MQGPNPSDLLARGKYMVRLGCGCHTVADGTNFAGGEHLAGPWGDVVSANITPDASGISYYDETTFITAMRTGYVGARKLNSYVDNSLPATYCKQCKQKHGDGDQNAASS